MVKIPYIYRRRYGGTQFTPANLFAASETGGWWEVKLGSIWQDTAGTSAATTAGQTVARVDDLSGNGNHLLQATAGSRPTLRQAGSGKWYLEFDGSSDWMSCAAFMAAGIAAGDGAAIITAIQNRDTSLINRNHIAEGNSGNNTPIIEAIRVEVNHLQTRYRSDGGTFYNVSADGITNPLTSQLDLYTFTDTGSSSALAINQVSEIAASAYTYAATTTNIFSVGALVRSTASGISPIDFYGAIARGKNITGTDLSNAEIYMADFAGITL